MVAMDGPIVFISRNRVKPGMLDAFLAHYRATVPMTEANKPDTLVQLAYLSEDGTEVIVVRVFASADGLDRQLQGAEERSKATYAFIEPVSVELYGTPSDYVMEMMRKVAGSGIDVRVDPQFIGGFTRLGPG